MIKKNNNTILDKINNIKDKNQGINKGVVSVLDKFKEYYTNIDNMLNEAKKVSSKTKDKDVKKSSDKTVKVLQKLLDKQTKEFDKIVKKLDLAIDDENNIVVDKKNMKKINNVIGDSGGVFSFNYSDPLTKNFTAENPLDAHPLGVFISNIGTGSDGSLHCCMINLHHIPSTGNLRKMFWNWIIREFLIAGKNNRRKLMIPSTLYFVLKDNPEFRFALAGYRRYSYAQIKGLKKLTIKEYDNVFTPKYKARFKVWNDRLQKFVPRAGK